MTVTPGRWRNFVAAYAMDAWMSTRQYMLPLSASVWFVRWAWMRSASV